MWPVSKRIWTSSHLRGITTGWPKSLFLGGTAVAISFLWVPASSQIAHISKHELLEQSTFWAAGPHSKQQQLACTPFITYTVVISWPVSISLLSCTPRGSGQLSVCVWIFPRMQVLWADIRYFHQYTDRMASLQRREERKIQNFVRVLSRAVLQLHWTPPENAPGTLCGPQTPAVIFQSTLIFLNLMSDGGGFDKISHACTFFDFFLLKCKQICAHQFYSFRFKISPVAQRAKRSVDQCPLMSCVYPHYAWTT